MSYSGNLDTSDLDWVRFRIGDTDTTDEQVSDTEITALLTVYGSKEAAAYEAARGLASKYARQATKAVGDLKINLSDLHKQFLAIAADIKKTIATNSAVPLAGGISKSRKETVQADTDRVRPRFRRDQFAHYDRDNDDDPYDCS